MYGAGFVTFGGRLPDYSRWTSLGVDPDAAVVTAPALVLTGNSVAEDAANGTVVGTVSIDAPYIGGAVFSLTDSAGGKFAINASTGVVTKANTLDYESATSHNITVAVSGTTPAIAAATFTINVTDVVENITNGTVFFAADYFRAKTCYGYGRAQ